MEIFTRYSLTFRRVSAVGSQWSAMPEWAVKWTESSLCLICDVHVFAFGSGSTKKIGECVAFFFHSNAKKSKSFCTLCGPQTVVHLVAEFYYNSEKLKGSLSTSTVFDFFKLFFNVALCHLVDWRTCLNLYFYRSPGQADDDITWPIQRRGWRTEHFRRNSHPSILREDRWTGQRPL